MSDSILHTVVYQYNRSITIQLRMVNRGRPPRSAAWVVRFWMAPDLYPTTFLALAMIRWAPKFDLSGTQNSRSGPRDSELVSCKRSLRCYFASPRKPPLVFKNRSLWFWCPTLGGCLGSPYNRTGVEVLSEDQIDAVYVHKRSIVINSVIKLSTNSSPPLPLVLSSL